MTQKILNEYSPLGLLILALPFFIPVEREMTRRLVLLFCAAPGILVALFKPKDVLKNPVLLLVILFTGYFSAQHLRGMLPLNTHIVRMTLTTAVQIIGPAFILSQISPHRKYFRAFLLPLQNPVDSRKRLSAIRINLCSATKIFSTKHAITSY